MIYKDFQFNSILEKYTNFPALSWPEGEQSYHEYFKQIDIVAQGLRKHGLKEKQSVAILSDIHKNFPIIFFAIIKAGGIAVSLHSTLPPNQLRQCMDHTSSKYVITIGEKTLPIDIPGIETITDKDLLETGKDDPCGYKSWSINFDRDISILFTSGSRGRAKGVLHTFGNHYYSALGSAENIPLQAKDFWLASLPFYHIAGISILFRTLLAGATCVIPDAGKSIQDQIGESKATHLSMVETQLRQHLKSSKKDKNIPSLKAVLLGGGPISGSLIKQTLQRKIPVYVSYGSTEMCSQITTTKPDELKDKPGSSGKVLPYRELKIGPEKEIFVRGKTLCTNYMIDGKRKKVAGDSEWFHTGDLGYLDDDGSLFVLGRKDNMFISGGENIHPEEIEHCLLNHQHISEVCVVDIPDKDFGARPVAFVKTTKNRRFDHTDLIIYLKQYLPKYKIPDYFLPWPASVNSLKPNRKKLRQLARELHS